MSPQLLDIENLVILVILAILFVFSLRDNENVLLCKLSLCRKTANDARKKRVETLLNWNLI